MKQSYNIIRNRFIIMSVAIILMTAACKKNKDDPKKQVATTSIQVILPAGSSLNLSNTEVYSLSQSFNVGSDGKSNIAFNAGSNEVVFLFDGNIPVMAGIISDDNKEISIATTAQALLYYGLGTMYVSSMEERVAQIKKITTYPQFTVLKTSLEKLFIDNPQMLSTDAYKDAYVKAVSEIHNKPVLDLIGKQIKVNDADDTKSGMTVRAQSGSDENMEVLNSYARRGHAYMYKIAYRDKNNYPYTVLSEIQSNTPADYNMAVRGASGITPETSGPQSLPLQNYESESTWKVRVIGVGGKESSSTMTDAEKTKYEEMCVDFFAVDLLMPLILDNLNQSKVVYSVLPNNIDKVRAYINEVKSLVKPETIELVKEGDYTQAITDFSDYALWDSYNREHIYEKLLECISDIVSANELQALSDIKANEERQQSFVKIIKGGLFSWLINANVDDKANPIDSRFTHISNSSKLNEWTVLSKDNDVTITPKHSKIMKLVDHTLTASATAALSAGEKIEYVWSTPGLFGVFKQNGAEVTTTTSSASKTITYYGKLAPNDDNVETIFVKASIIGPSGTRVLGTDTAYVNVKKLTIVMKPNGATLTPKNGTKSITLKLLNADGSYPFSKGTGVQFKVVWSTPGNYGLLDGNVTTYETPKNTVVYTATDENVLSATENIKASVFFKLSDTGWRLRDEITGTVKISNDPKKIIYYAPLTTYHQDRNDAGGNLWHYSNCGVAITPVVDAVTYSAKITLGSGSTYSETWSATNPGWLYGYMYAIDPATTGTYYIGYGANWGSCVHNGCEHRISDCSGGEAQITIIVK